VSRTICTLQRIARTEAPALPTPGGGHTWARFEALSRWAATDLSLGRLAEGHVDALAILAEAGMEVADQRATYGVWAARSPGGTVARRAPDGWHLSGRKEFCSGSLHLDRALVTADADDGYRLFDIDVSAQVTSSDPDSWPAVGMADSLSETLSFGGPAVPATRAVGGPEFYVDRPGFWFGSVGVAACWYGGAVGLVEHAVRALEATSSELVLAPLGEAVAHVEAMRAILHDAANEIDADPIDRHKRARRRALVVRQAVHRGSSAVLERVVAATGARPLCHDRDQARRAADLVVYLAQHHGLRDAVELARMAVDGGAWN
jgi:alkylation response protein AidB-like acyl-CoA dehydrogenase